MPVRWRLSPVCLVLSLAGAPLGDVSVGAPSVGAASLGDEPRHITLAPEEQIAVRLQLPDHAAASAERVVLLPGVLGSAYSMRHVTRALVARGHAVLVVDPLGMGASSHPIPADYTLDAQARRLLAVLDTIGWSKVVVAGHGTSATIALHAAAIAPARVLGIVSIAGGPVATQATGGVETALRFSGLLSNPVGRALARRRFVHQLRERSASDRWLTDGVVHEYLRPLEQDLRGTLRGLRAMGEAREPRDLGDVLRQVVAPVCLLVGDTPGAGGPTDGQIATLLQAVPRVRVDTVAHAGSMLHEEQPGAVVNAIAGVARFETPE